MIVHLTFSELLAATQIDTEAVSHEMTAAAKSPAACSRNSAAELTAARKLTNDVMTKAFSASEMATSVLSDGHQTKSQLDQSRIS